MAAMMVWDLSLLGYRGKVMGFSVLVHVLLLVNHKFMLVSSKKYITFLYVSSNKFSL